MIFVLQVLHQCTHCQGLTPCATQLVYRGHIAIFRVSAVMFSLSSIHSRSGMLLMPNVPVLLFVVMAAAVFRFSPGHRPSLGLACLFSSPALHRRCSASGKRRRSSASAGQIYLGELW